MPYYNFERGEREYRNESIALDSHSILLIEGIHGLNPELTRDVVPEMKYRIYVSALTTLAIDDHNWVSTTDNRLLRRIIPRLQVSRYECSRHHTPLAERAPGRRAVDFPLSGKCRFDVQFLAAVRVRCHA